jgi:hypothetical protein
MTRGTPAARPIKGNRSFVLDRSLNDAAAVEETKKPITRIVCEATPVTMIVAPEVAVFTDVLLSLATVAE